MNTKKPNDNQFGDNRTTVSGARISRVEEKSIIRKHYDFAVSGWIATFLGFYLFSTGAYSLVRLITVTDSGDSILKIFPEFIDDSSVATDKFSVLVLMSYVAGLPMFAGSALMAIGSLARNTSRLSSARTEEIFLNPNEWIVKCSNTQQLFSGVLQILATYDVPSASISESLSRFGPDSVYIHDTSQNLVATCSRNAATGDWLVKILLE
jgi:hypothetical protein